MPETIEEYYKDLQKLEKDLLRMMEIARKAPFEVLPEEEHY